MSVVASDGLALMVGDGASTESFASLPGLAITRLELQQRSNLTNTLGGDAWQVNVGISARQLLIECDAYANNATAATRLQSVALAGIEGNFKLLAGDGKTWIFTARVMQYREEMPAGGIKRIRLRLESSGAVSLV